MDVTEALILFAFLNLGHSNLFSDVLGSSADMAVNFHLIKVSLELFPYNLL